MSKIVIFGITGYAGGSIANELLDRGHHVVGIARQPDGVEARAHLDVRTGSVYDATLVGELAEGADAIVIAVRVLQDDGRELVSEIPTLLKAAEASGARIGVVGGAASLFVAEGGPRVIDAGFPERRELWRLPGYLAVVTVAGTTEFGRPFPARIAAAVRRYR